MPYGVAFPLSPAAVTATTIVSSSMPINRVGCSVSEAHTDHPARPSSTAHGETGHLFRMATVHRVERLKPMPCNTDRLVSRRCALRTSAEPWSYFLPGFPEPETDTRSVMRAARRNRSHLSSLPAPS